MILGRKLSTWCSRLHGVPPKRYVYLEPQNVILIGITALTDVIKVRIRGWDHPGFRWALNPMTSLLKWGRKGEYIKAQVEKVMWRQRQRLGWYSHKPWDTWNHQKLEEAGRNLPSSFWRSVILPTPWFQASCLQTVYCFKPPRLWWFAAAALGD